MGLAKGLQGSPCVRGVRAWPATAEQPLKNHMGQRPTTHQLSSRKARSLVDTHSRVRRGRSREGPEAR